MSAKKVTMEELKDLHFAIEEAFRCSGWDGWSSIRVYEKMKRTLKMTSEVLDRIRAEGLINDH